MASSEAAAYRKTRPRRQGPAAPTASRQRPLLLPAHAALPRPPPTWREPRLDVGRQPLHSKVCLALLAACEAHSAAHALRGAQRNLRLLPHLRPPHLRPAAEQRAELRHMVHQSGSHQGASSVMSTARSAPRQAAASRHTSASPNRGQGGSNGMLPSLSTCSSMGCGCMAQSRLTFQVCQAVRVAVFVIATLLSKEPTVSPCWPTYQLQLVGGHCRVHSQVCLLGCHSRRVRAT